jgi:hypothetical protein
MTVTTAKTCSSAAPDLLRVMCTPGQSICRCELLSLLPGCDGRAWFGGRTKPNKCAYQTKPSF